MPKAIDLFCGLGGWTDGLIAEGYDVIGYDIEEHAYGDMRYQGKLIVQDVCTLHGAQFKDVDLIVASPPCQEYSYMAMPWSLAKAKAKAIREDTTGEKLAALNRLFNECFRIQREASFAAGRHVPLVVENVRGAQPWVGRARWNFGSFYLWGDVPALMPSRSVFGEGPGVKRAGRTMCYPAGSANPEAVKGRTGKLHWQDEGHKVPGFRFDGSGRSFQTASVVSEGIKGSDGYDRDHPEAFGWKKPRTSSGSNARKAASAQIAMIPLTLSRYIGATYRPA
jgi:hypothetical protein